MHVCVFIPYSHDESICTYPWDWSITRILFYQWLHYFTGRNYSAWWHCRFVIRIYCRCLLDTRDDMLRFLFILCWNKEQIYNASGTKHWIDWSYIVPILDIFYFTHPVFVFNSGHRNQVTCSLLGGFSKPRAAVIQLLDSGLCSI